MSSPGEIPPQPEQVLDSDRIQYQAMTDLSDDDYRRLAADIRENGVLQPVIVDDSEQQVIIDGHHREAIAKHYDLPEEKQPSYVTVSGMDDDRKLARAIKQNLIGRDTTDGVKHHAVKQYIEMAWEYDEDAEAYAKPETQEEVADKLGVSRATVKRVFDNGHLTIIEHDRLRARRYYENNPDASYREVARHVDRQANTVARWLKEDFDEGDNNDDEQETLAVTARDRDEAEAVAEVTRTATDGGDGTAATVASEQAEALARNETTPDRAAAEVEQARNREAEEPDTETPPLPDDTYRTVVIDPPWNIEKIERVERPQQGQYLDYPTMDIDEIQDLPVPELLADSGGHVYLWTTQKHLPTALECLDEWGARYECMLTWVKPTGVAPFSWQYNTEHVLFGRYGDGLELDKQGIQLSFEAPVTEHSAKPEVFYERVKTASPGPRLEMFAREARDGFDVWGDEVTDSGSGEDGF